MFWIITEDTYCVHCIVREAQKRRWLCFSVLHKNADGSVFPSAIAPPPYCFFGAIAYVMAHIWHVGQANMHNHGQGNGCFSGNDQGQITDGKTDPSAFLRFANGTTDAKSARGNDS
jgi:hypothetical protein